MHIEKTMRLNRAAGIDGDFPKGGSYTSNVLRIGGMEAMFMKNDIGALWGILGMGLLAMPAAVAVGASNGPVTGDSVMREAQEAVIATQDYTIQHKDAFQRKAQAELEDVQQHITRLRGQVEHASAEARVDIQKSIAELEKKKDLASKKLEALHSATASSWEQVKSKAAAAMDDLRDSLNRTLSHFPSR